jgi:hypothetical protein
VGKEKFGRKVWFNRIEHGALVKSNEVRKRGENDK